MSSTLLRLVRRASQLRALCAALDATLITRDGVLLCGPHAIHLYRSLPPSARPYAGLQCWFALRWSELEKLPLQAIARHRPLPIRTTKGGRPRMASTLLGSGVMEWRAVTVNVIPDTFSYDTVSRETSRAIARCGIVYPPDMCGVTHIWRHLRAQWMLHQGASIDDIARVLGHRSTDSTRAYLRHGIEIPGIISHQEG